MSDQDKKHLSHIRTFAKDLDTERDRRKVAAEKSSEVPEVKVVEAEKMAETPIAAPVVTERNHPKHQNAVIPKITVPPPKPDTEIKSEVHTKIPAFHELHKQKNHAPEQDLLSKESVSKDTTKNISAAAKVRIVEPDESAKPAPKHVYGGTVITDQKKSDFKLIQSIIASIKGWFESISLRNKKSKVPTYTVPETNHRKGVIQKATSKTATIFTADNDTLKEKIRRRRQQELEAGHEIETSWSPYTETGYNLLEAPAEKQDVTKNVVVEFKKQTRLQVAPPAPAEPVAPVIVPTPVTEEKEVVQSPAVAPVVLPPVPEEVPLPPTPEAPIQPQETQQEKEEAPVLVPADIAPEEEPEVVLDDTADDETELVADEDSRPKPANLMEAVRQFDTNTIAVLLLLVVLGLAAIFYIARVVYVNFSDDSEIVSSAGIPQQELVAGATRVAIKINKDNPGLAISEALDNLPAGLVEASIVTPSEEELGPNYTFQLLKFHTTPSFGQSVTVMRVVRSDQTAPAMVLRFTDADTIRGGLLQWEPNMGQDLTIMFNKDDWGSAAKFSDDTAGGHDVRVLSDGEATKLVYGVINNNVVITADRDSFVKIVEFGFTK